jgi:hypothetical protein
MGEWGGRVAQALVRRVLEVYGDTCHLCLEPGSNSADHLVPRSKGGTDAIENLRPAHRRCNYQRGDRSVAWWRAKYRPDLLAPPCVDGRGFFDGTGQDTPRRRVHPFPGETKNGADQATKNDPITTASEARK